ncbi:MAG: UvrD-helicase domain-containing protein [Pirellulales bacterium]|nr:UvrD-helicase domain-containing protein [Pirellulales bacterium]
MHARLNPAQLEAVTTISGPLLVLAGAGTGKTSVVTHRIAELARRGVRPDHILAVTFTNKAAAEMQQRAATLLGRQLPERPHISTFHSLCVRVLRRNARVLGLPVQFAIYDRADQETIARRVLRELRVPGEHLRPSDLLSQIGRWKTLGLLPDRAAEVAGTDKDHLAASGYRRYQGALRAAGAVDFDDLLLLTQGLLTQQADVRRREAALYTHVLIDEYQDTNQPQYQIVKALVAGHRNLCVVGDDDQSIYGWRGAEVSHILGFRRDWPDAKVVRLEQNYRSTAPILELANRLIRFNRQRHDKVLRSDQPGEPPRIVKAPDEVAEAESVVAEIRERLQAPGSEPRDFAILFRTNEQPRPFETELRRQQVPYIVVGGMSFFDRKEVRDVFAYLRLLVEPRDDQALLRIVNTPPRGLGPTLTAKLMSRAVEAGKPLWEILRDPSQRGPVPAAAAAGIRDFVANVTTATQQLKTDRLHDVARNLIQHIRYRDELVRVYPDPNELLARSNAVDEVLNALANYERRAKRPTLTGFLDDMLLSERDEDPAEAARRRNAVTLLTLHSAKGLEFREVYLVGLEDGLLPHHRAIEADGSAIDEERRLCYVGVTRARERLTVSFAAARMKWGKSRPTKPSRFLHELSGQAVNPRATKSLASEPRPVRQGIRAARPASAIGRPRTVGPTGTHPRPKGRRRPNAR